MTFEFIEIDQGSPEWHELRSRKIGASDAPAIMGVSPWSTAYQTWEEKAGLRPAKFDTEQMKRGREVEKFALAKFNRTMGLNLRPRVVQSLEHEFMISSFDGCDEYGEIVVEMKYPGSLDDHCAEVGLVPDKYIPQVQHQMICIKPKRHFYYSFDGDDGVILENEPDIKYQSNLLLKESQFYDCMLTFTPPKMTDSDYLTREDEEWRKIAEKYFIVSTSISDLEKEEKNLKDQLILLAGGLNVKGAGISLYKTVRRGNVDYSAIPELKSINLENYRKSPSEYWTIRK